MAINRNISTNSKSKVYKKSNRSSCIIRHKNKKDKLCWDKNGNRTISHLNSYSKVNSNINPVEETNLQSLDSSLFSQKSSYSSPMACSVIQEPSVLSSSMNNNRDFENSVQFSELDSLLLSEENKHPIAESESHILNHRPPNEEVYSFPSLFPLLEENEPLGFHENESCSIERSHENISENSPPPVSSSTVDIIQSNICDIKQCFSNFYIDYENQGQNISVITSGNQNYPGIYNNQTEGLSNWNRCLPIKLEAEDPISTVQYPNEMGLINDKIKTFDYNSTDIPQVKFGNEWTGSPNQWNVKMENWVTNNSNYRLVY